MKGQRITAHQRAEQFKDEFYADSGRYCEHCLDCTRIDTIKDHVKSPKHINRPSKVGLKGVKLVAAAAQLDKSHCQQC